MYILETDTDGVDKTVGSTGFLVNPHVRELVKAIQSFYKELNRLMYGFTVPPIIIIPSHPLQNASSYGSRACGRDGAIWVARYCATQEVSRIVDGEVASLGHVVVPKISAVALLSNLRDIVST